MELINKDTLLAIRALTSILKPDSDEFFVITRLLDHIEILEKELEERTKPNEIP